MSLCLDAPSALDTIPQAACGSHALKGECSICSWRPPGQSAAVLPAWPLPQPCLLDPRSVYSNPDVTLTWYPTTGDAGTPLTSIRCSYASSSACCSYMHKLKSTGCPDLLPQQHVLHRSCPGKASLPAVCCSLFCTRRCCSWRLNPQVLHAFRASGEVISPLPSCCSHGCMGTGFSRSWRMRCEAAPVSRTAGQTS